MLRIFFLFLCVFTTARAVEFPGTWSNGKSEFQTVSLMLRSDGQAIFASAVLPAYALWEKSDSGFILTVGGDGQGLSIPFTYDESTGLITGRLGNDEVVMKKVSDQEPPDLLARARERAAEEQEHMKKLWRSETRTFADRAAVRVFIRDWLAETDRATHAESVFLSAAGEDARLTLRGLGTCFLKIGLETRRIAQPTGYPLESKLLKDDAVSALPLVYALAPAKVEQLRDLAAAPGVTCETHAFSQVSVFKTEMFFRSQQFMVKPGETPDALTLADRILDILWPAQAGEITAMLSFRTTPLP